MEKGFLNPYELIREFDLKKGMSVADFGSGAGHFSLAIANRVGKEGAVNAVDVREGVLSVLAGHAKLDGLMQIKTVRGNLEKANGSSLKKVSQDMVLCANILHQADKPKAILREAHRVLKQNGELLVIDWTDASNSFGPPERISQSEAEKLAREVGFQKVRELADTGAAHYGLVFQKEER